MPTLSDVTLRTEVDDGGNEHEVKTLEYNGQTYRFSPNSTDEEIQAQLDELGQI